VVESEIDSESITDRDEIPILNDESLIELASKLVLAAEPVLVVASETRIKSSEPRLLFSGDLKIESLMTIRSELLLVNEAIRTDPSVTVVISDTGRAY
jgi:hypothetical protein